MSTDLGTRSAWRDQARQDLDLLNETALVLTATDRALLETAEELSSDVLQAFVADTSEAIRRYVSLAMVLAMVLAMAQTRIRPLLDAALDGRLQASRRARVALEAERNRASIERLRAMLAGVPKAA